MIQYIMYDGWIVKRLLRIFYGMVILISFVVMIGMTTAWEMYIYITHLIVIVLCGIANHNKWKRRTLEENKAIVQDESVKAE
ncbi:hypothetical protein [Anaerovorax odorimutans]|uniref:hypothetical protein n=1 Tax=Anaerovorax odorimutans TaxID=109327 RepID=UPI00210C2B06|nr:hypothetical protein [Anaerovorax odorimutans]